MSPNVPRERENMPDRDYYAWPMARPRIWLGPVRTCCMARLAVTPNGCLELPATAPLPLGPENDRRSAPTEGLKWLERRLDRDLLMDA